MTVGGGGGDDGWVCVMAVGVSGVDGCGSRMGVK